MIPPSIRLMFRWKVLKAVLELIWTIGDAYEDSHLSKAEQKIVMSKVWHLMRVYRGVKEK